MQGDPASLSGVVQRLGFSYPVFGWLVVRVPVCKVL